MSDQQNHLSDLLFFRANSIFNVLQNSDNVAEFCMLEQVRMNCIQKSHFRNNKLQFRWF